MKKTKFELEKYQGNLFKTSNIIIKAVENNFERKNLTISEKWLIQKRNNCRYNSFITMFYFTISSFITNIKDKNLIFLNELNDLVLKMAKDVNENNYVNIIIFFQKIKFDTNNSLIDQIINEEYENENEIGKQKIMDSLDNIYKNNNNQKLIENAKEKIKNSDINSLKYWENMINKTHKQDKEIIGNYWPKMELSFENYDFDEKEFKKHKIFIDTLLRFCEIKKILEDNLDNKPFIQINNNDMNEKYIYNILLKRYKELYSYDCECRKNSNEDVLCTKTKYKIISYPKI